MSYQRKSVYQVYCKVAIASNCRDVGPPVGSDEAANPKDEAYRRAMSEGWFAAYGQDAKCPECREEAYNRSLREVDSP
jgi:hypothetical protein